MKKSKTTIRTYINIYNRYFKAFNNKEAVKELAKIRLALSGKNKGVVKK